MCVHRLRVSSLLCEHEILCHQVHLLRFAQLRQGIPPGFAKYTTGKTRTPNAKYNYEPEDLGCIKFLYDLCTTTVAKTGPTSTPTTCVPLPSTLKDSVDVKFLAVTPNMYET